MCKTRIDDWSKEERAELAVPEFDPDYLPAGMTPPAHWYTENGEYVGITLELPATFVGQLA